MARVYLHRSEPKEPSSFSRLATLRFVVFRFQPLRLRSSRTTCSEMPENGSFSCSFLVCGCVFLRLCSFASKRDATSDHRSTVLSLGSRNGWARGRGRSKRTARMRAANRWGMESSTSEAREKRSPTHADTDTSTTHLVHAYVDDGTRSVEEGETTR